MCHQTLKDCHFVLALCSTILQHLTNPNSNDRYSADAIERLLNSLTPLPVGEFDEQKLAFVQTQYANKQSVIKKIEQLTANDLTPNEYVRQIEENGEAINILIRFHKDTCIVCDTEGINRERLLAAKQANKQRIIEALNTKVRDLIEQIIQLLPSADPFILKDRLLDVVAKGDADILATIRAEFMHYRTVYNALVINGILEVWHASLLMAHLAEYNAVIAERPDISDEDYLYIQEIISTSMNKPLSVERDTNNRLKIHLNHEEFLGKARDELPLSTGEQNFLSLTFEFLKAKNSACPIVVIDDPISSFDSIYKNKVVYAIVKMLHDKMRIILTHNTDLIRLLDTEVEQSFLIRIFSRYLS